MKAKYVLWVLLFYDLPPEPAGTFDTHILCLDAERDWFARAISYAWRQGMHVYPKAACLPQGVDPYEGVE